MRALDRGGRSAGRFAALLASAALGPCAQAASFDCARASSAMERRVCADPALGARDAILGRLYAAALRTDARTSVEASQRTWLASARTCATVSCLARAYDARIGRLQRSAAGVAAGTSFFTEQPEGNHGTLTVLGPVHGFASVSVMSNFVGAGGIDAGDVDTAATDAVLDLRRGPATIAVGRCRLTFARLDANRWKVGQAGRCDLPGGTVYAGIYLREKAPAPGGAR